VKSGANKLFTSCRIEALDYYFVFYRFSEGVFQEYYFKPQYYIKTGQILGKAVVETWNDARLGRIATMIWEYDDRYRYCFQLAFSLLNKENFAQNPRKELRRLCDELIAREEEENTAKKWRAVKKALALLPLKNVVRCINKLDCEAMKLDEDDLHFARQKKGFNYNN